VTASSVTAVAKLRRLRGVVWEWRDDAPPEAKNQPGMGVIAQEVEAVFPELVEIDEHGRRSVEYDGLIPPLYAAVTELAARLQSLSPPETERSGAVNDAEKLAQAATGPHGTELDPDAVARVFPQLVSTDESGAKVVAYHSLVGPLIEAVKELDTRLSALERAHASGPSS
jgi:Chaperone of endosialidase